MRELIAQAEQPAEPKSLRDMTEEDFMQSQWPNRAFRRVEVVEQPAEPVALQAGMNNAELLTAWMNKLPGTEPSERDLRAFAVGSEVGFDRARALEKADWMRIHYVLKDAGIHPGRTDDHLADVIARALKPDPRVAELEGLLREAAADKYWANFVLKERIAAALGEG